MLKCCLTYCLLLVVSIISISAQGQTIFEDTIHLKEITIKAKAKIADYSMQTRKIDSLQISNSIHTDISEILRDNTSVYIKSTARGSIASISLRGTNSSHTKVSWNDIPLNSPMHGSLDMSQLPFFFTDKIEIQYSGASMLDSDGALGGSLKLGTLPIWKEGFSFEFTSAIGSFNSYDEFLKVNYSTKKFSTSVRAFYSSSENDFKYINNDIIDGGEMFRKNADFTNYGFMQSLNYRPRQNQFIKLDIWLQNGDRGVPGLSTNESGNDNNISRQEDQVLRSTLSWNIHKKLWKLKAWTSIDKQETDFTVHNYISGVGRYNALSANSNSTALYSGFSSVWNPSKKNQLTGIIRHQYNSVISSEEVKNTSFSATRHDIFMSFDYEHNITKSWNTNILLKEDIIQGEFFIPNIALSTAGILKDKIAISLSLSRNMHHPTLNDLYYVPGGNPLLKPESAYTADLGLGLNIENNFSWSHKLNIYARSIKDWILWRPSIQGYWEPDNISEVQSAGIEYNSILSKTFGKIKTNIKFSYSLNRSVNLSLNDFSIFEKGGQIPYVPIHSINIRSGINWNNFYLQYQWNYYSERYTTSNNTPDILYALYPYYMSDIHLGTKIPKGKVIIHITASIFNIFNESYRSVLWQPMSGRNFQIGLKIRFR